MTLPGDEAAFAALFERHRRELQVHCYRMLGSLHDAEDLVQETFLRAWRNRESFEGRSSFRTWLYRIATNACLDALERRRARPAQLGGGFGEIPWLQPYPDHLLEEVADTEAGPDSTVVAKETIELAFQAAIQHLPPSQRAVLILRGVLGWSAKDTASLLDTSVPSANSALQRARETMQRRLPERPAEWTRDAAPSVEEPRAPAAVHPGPRAGGRGGFRRAAERGRELLDAAGAHLGRGPREVMRYLTAHGFGSPDVIGELRLVPVRANRQPGAAKYVRLEAARDAFVEGLQVAALTSAVLMAVTAAVAVLVLRRREERVPYATAAW